MLIGALVLGAVLSIGATQKLNLMTLVLQNFNHNEDILEIPTSVEDPLFRPQPYYKGRGIRVKWSSLWGERKLTGLVSSRIT